MVDLSFQAYDDGPYFVSGLCKSLPCVRNYWSLKLYISYSLGKMQKEKELVLPKARILVVSLQFVSIKVH